VAIRVLIVEDDNLTRLTLSSTLDISDSVAVKAAATSADALEVEKTFRPHAALIDLDLGVGPSGLDLAGALRRHNPEVGIVFLTSYEDPRLVSGAGHQLPAGSQYLIKKHIQSVDQILSAVHQSLYSRKVTSVGELAMTEFGKLTNAQVETLRLVAQGLSNIQIADTLGVNEKAIEQQVTRIARRLGVSREDGKNTRVGIARAYFLLTGSPSNNAN